MVHGSNGSSVLSAPRWTSWWWAPVSPGLYLLHRLRQPGFSVQAFEAAGDVGGTWYWNRYPGARCDIPTTDYAYSFDPELEREWAWSEKYATQPEILAYLRHVADRYDLRRDIEFSTRVRGGGLGRAAPLAGACAPTAARRSRCRFYVMASGCLSLPKSPDIDGHRAVPRRGLLHQPLAPRGRRLHRQAGGGDRHRARRASSRSRSSPPRPPSSPCSSAPRTSPSRPTTGPPPAERLAALDGRPRRPIARRPGGRAAASPSRSPTSAGSRATEEVRRARFEAAWEAGELFAILGVFNDQMVNPASNEIVAEMIREKIRSIVHDPDTAEALCPKDHPFGTKRPCLDTDYFQTFNLPHVRLVDLRKQPIATITESGIDTVDESLEFDAIVYATGFDAMTGPLVAVDVAGRDGVALKREVGGRPVDLPRAHAPSASPTSS